MNHGSHRNVFREEYVSLGDSVVDDFSSADQNLLTNRSRFNFKSGFVVVLTVFSSILIVSLFISTWSYSTNNNTQYVLRDDLFNESEFWSSAKRNHSAFDFNVKPLLSATKSSSKEVCLGWNDDENGPPPCLPSSSDVLRRALQDENCRAAKSGRSSREDVGEKLLKLISESLFVFFRGSVGLFFYNLYCVESSTSANYDEFVPYVTSSGDSHPENFGTLTLANGNLTWGVNDFDHSLRSPFIVDVARGATGFILACRERGDLSAEECIETAEIWTKGYSDVFHKQKCLKLINHDRFVEGANALKNVRGGYLVHKVFEKARKRSEKKGLEKWLKKYLDLDKLKFLKSDELIPVDKSKFEEFETAIETYLFNGVAALAKFPSRELFEILDVIEKKGSGTGSIGLKRYYILMKGAPSNVSKSDHLILEMKEVINSVLERYVDDSVPDILEGKRACDGGNRAYPFANIYHGWLHMNGRSYIIRRKNPLKKAVKLQKLSKKEFVDYAYVSAVAQAHYHLLVGCNELECRLEDPAMVDKESCVGIAKYIDSQDNFSKRIAAFALQEALREFKQYSILQKTFRDNKTLQEDPVLFLNHIAPDGGSLWNI
eukprot:CAMPEP_0182447828 /NCGR_PEP_ID=MMETSP1172-20130603/20733_1 /TAXON_ID=708627 /ORGANISM="Timspurckia oligopyrenoides, Strain CCMP3278" /LENGTH=602 /DNA_ID=CAMNT_0024644427 /DNA_START=12 /DNA_END=1823 /DNA_ORIENTATION=-